MKNLLFYNIIIIFFILFCNRVIFSGYILESIQGNEAVIIDKGDENKELVRINGYIIDTNNNNVSIDSKNDICAIIKDKNSKYILVCKSGLVIRDICKLKYYNKPLKFLFNLKNYVGIRSISNNLDLDQTNIYYICEKDKD